MATPKSTFENLPVEIIIRIGELTIEPFATTNKPFITSSTTKQYTGGYQSLRNLRRCSRTFDDALGWLLGTHIVALRYGQTPDTRSDRWVSDLVKNLTFMADVNKKLKLEKVQEFTFSSTYFVAWQSDQIQQAVKYLVRVLKGMTGLKKIRFDGGRNTWFHSAFTAEASRADLALTKVKDVAATLFSYYILKFTPNVARFASWSDLSPPRYSTISHANDLMQALQDCPSIDTVELEMIWNESLIRSVLATKPNLKRLGMIGSKADKGRIRFDGALGAEYHATDGILYPPVHELLSQFKNLEVLVVPNLVYLGVFRVSKESLEDVDDRLIVDHFTEWWALHDVEDDDVSKDRKHNPRYHDGESDTQSRRRCDYAYDLIAKTSSVALPNLQELWICGFPGVKETLNTDAIRDVRIKFTKEGEIKTWTVTRGVLLDRVDDGRLPYGVGPIKRPAHEDRWMFFDKTS